MCPKAERYPKRDTFLVSCPAILHYSSVKGVRIYLLANSTALRVAGVLIYDPGNWGENSGAI
jgi:hypothetical protein